MAGQNETATHHFNVAFEQVVLRDCSDQVFDVGVQIEVHYPRKTQVNPNTDRGDCWTTTTAIATAEGIGRLKSSVGDESRLIGARFGGGTGISPGERYV